MASVKLRGVAVSVLLFAATLGLFSRAVRYGFINYDDPTYVTDNPHVQVGLTGAGVVWAFTAATDYWHPLTWLSHMLDWQMYGPTPTGHHWTSVGLHAANAVLVLLLFSRFGGTLGLSAFAAALFAWHPLRVESVVWITERKDVLSGTFFLLTLLAYMNYVSRRREGRPWRTSYALTLLGYAAGLMSKPMLVTLPVVLLILDYWPLRRCDGASGSTTPDSIRRVMAEKLPFFALSAITAIVTVLMQRHIGAFVLEVPLGARISNALVSIARYLGKMAWPTELIICYPHPGAWPISAVVSAGALLGVLTLCAWRMRHSRPWVIAGGSWFLVMLLPVLGLVQVGFQAMADRYTYLPLLGVELAVLWPLAPWLRTMPRLALAGAIALLVPLGIRTWQQQAVWRDSVTLFQHAVDVTDRNPVAEDFLASALLAANRLDDAAVQAERAHRDAPRNAAVVVTLADIRERQGRAAEALTLYREALQLRPADATVQMQLGLLEFRAGHVAEARSLMIAGLRADARLRPRTFELGELALQQRDPRGARFFFELVTETDPQNATAHVGLGTSLILLGDREAGLAAWRRALALDPQFPNLREQMERVGGR